MQLLIDSDVFCKFAICGVLDDVVAMLGRTRADCRRLEQLGHILQNPKAKLYKQLGAQHAAVAADAAKHYKSLPLIDPRLLELFQNYDGIDPGEVQLFAATAAAPDTLLLTGDKRAIKALRGVPEHVRARLAGKLVPQDAALLKLCERHGIERIVEHVHPCNGCDGTMRICFPRARCDPRECLESFARELGRSTDPAVIHPGFMRV